MITSIFLVLTLLQYPYPQRRLPPGAGTPDTRGTITDAVASFEGKFKSADKKYVTIEVEEGQSMRMYITGSTKFFRDDKQVKASDFKTDEHVTVDASRDMRMNLLAVRVTATKPRPKAEN
jgi:hypothetical protein